MFLFPAASSRIASSHGVADADLSVCIASGARRLGDGFREFQNRLNLIGFVSSFGPLCLTTQVLVWFGAYAFAQGHQIWWWLLWRLGACGAVRTYTLAS